ncbi:hypothetical protein SUGI_0458000 [Cryptomeria japonica]|nr:hypothetical protein SUGI_0458000 [Cryptomeria japonica]
MSEDKADVVQLHLSGFGFNSSIWQDVCKLQALQFLDLSNNSVSTPSADDIRSCTSLVSLNLSSNVMSSFLPSLNSLQKLQSLDVSYNNLTGRTTPQIQNLTELKTFIVTYNSFDGSVAFGGVKLVKVDVSHNHFDGGFPQNLTKCTNLTYLDLSGNSFTGSIPDSISSLIKLETLVLSSNNFSGNIPSSLKALTKLSRFAINQNKLNGSIPKELSAITGLESLDLSYNKLSGSIPLQVFSLSNLKSLDLTTNLLSGEIPQNFPKSFFRLRIGNNKLTGKIPPTVSNAPNLTYLEMNNNFLNGSIPKQLAKCTKLQLLDVGHNGLGGSLTDVLPKLLQLQYLKLPSNKFEGNILEELSNLTELTYVDLSDNLLSGSISPKIFELTRLQNLRLQNNRLAGIIPVNIQDSKSLLELQLGSNNLSGTIPQGVSNLYTLQIALNLSHNFLEGIIPPHLLNNKNIVFNCTGNLGLYKEQSIQSSTKKKKPSAGLLVGVAVAGAIFALGAVGLTMFACKYFQYKEHEVPEVQQPHTIEGRFIHPDSAHNANIDFEKGVEATTDPANMILKNKYNAYYKAVMPSGSSYSVKKLSWTDKVFKSGSHRRFEAELEKLGRFNHPNIMTPLAYVLDTDCAYLFYEYAHKGSLSEFLHTTGVCVLDWPSRCSIAICIAHGLAFLHGCQHPILHLDLSTKNIFLKSLAEAQIADTELCKIVDPSKSTGSLSGIAGSVGYMPPEYAYTMRVTAAGNVYSFGVILLELLTGMPPITSGMDLAKWVQLKLSGEEAWEQILDMRIRNFSLQIQTEMLSMLKVALTCINSSPDARPKMRKVVGTLQVIRQTS